MLRKRWALWATGTLIAAIAIPSAYAQTESKSLEALGVPITGRLFSDLYIPIRDVDTAGFRQISTSLWLQGDPKLGDHGSARFILATDAIEANNLRVGGGSQVRVNLREGYINYAKNGWDLRFGKQIIPWGISDGINPTDFLSAKDYAFFNPDEEVRRVGATSLWLNWTPAQGSSPWNFTLVATPIFPQTTILISPSVLPTGTTVQTPTLSPPQTLFNTELAFKTAFNGQGWDASVLAFRGWNHTPELYLVGLGGTLTDPSVVLGQTFHRYRAVGGDASLTRGNWIFRGESAYVWTENNDGQNMLVQPTHWDTVLGVERPIGDDFRAQAQFLYRYIPNFVDPSETTGATPLGTAVNQGIAEANALLLAYQFKNRTSGTFRFSYSNESNGIGAEIFVVANFVGGDYLVRPKFSYNWTDAIKTTAGLDYYGGPTDRPLGSLQAYNSVFLEGKYTF